MNTRNKLYKKCRKLMLHAARRFPTLRKVRYAYWRVQRRRFASKTAHVHTDAHLVVFEAFGGRSYACSPKAIYEQMCADARFDDWELCWSFQKKVMNRIEEEGRSCIGLNERARIVMRGSKEYFDVFEHAKYWVQNNRVPEYVVPRDDQVYVQCWHGTPLKRLGFDVPEQGGGALNSAHELAQRFAMDAEKWTYLLSPSAFTSEHLCDAFGLAPEKRAGVVIEEGYPRNDSIRATLDAPDAAERLAAMKERLGVPADKKLLLFAPTWRDDQYEDGVGYTMDAIIDLDELQARLGREWAVLLRMHYYIANKLDFSAWEGFVYDVSKADDINELYCIADVLCTDYSSVFFDYANTARPLVFYWPDREHYENDLHGFYIDADTLPGPKCATATQLCDELDNIDSWQERYGTEYTAFCQTYCAKDDGHAAARVVERVFGQPAAAHEQGA